MGQRPDGKPAVRFTLTQKLAAEFLGAALLLAIVVGSGIMGEKLAGGNKAIALLANTIATGAGLTVLIMILCPVSGAHFNPAVTFAFLLRKEIAASVAAAYVGSQILGAIIGVIVAHAMFDMELLQLSAKARFGAGQMIGEAIATFGLILTIMGCIRLRPESTPIAVGLFITAGYWFTSSTSFANPAVTIARTLTDTFSGIFYGDAPAFLLAEFAGAALAAGLAVWLFIPRDADSAARYTLNDEDRTASAV